MKESYIRPEVTPELFATEDVITTSDSDNYVDWNPEWGTNQTSSQENSR